MPDVKFFAFYERLEKASGHLLSGFVGRSTKMSTNSFCRCPSIILIILSKDYLCLFILRCRPGNRGGNFGWLNVPA